MGTLTSLYAIRNLDKILGLAGISSKCRATLHMFLSRIHMPSSARASCQSGEFLERSRSGMVCLGCDVYSTLLPITALHGLRPVSMPVLPQLCPSGHSGLRTYVPLYSPPTISYMLTKRMKRCVISLKRRPVSSLTRCQLRKFRAVPTVEMLRATWEKTTNPYVGVRFSTPPIASLIPR